MNLKTKWLLVVLIPLFAGVILIFTSNEYTRQGQSLLLQFTITAFITATIWLAVVFVFNKITKAYPDFKHTYKRLLILVPTTAFIALTIYLIDHAIISLLLHGKIEAVCFVDDVKTTIVATTIVYVLYECGFFYNNWKKTVLLSEQLQKKTP